MTDDIKNYRVYMTTGCPYCKKAVTLLLNKKKSFSVTVLDNDIETLQELKKQYNWQTVPLIVAKTKDDKELFLGGFSDLEQTFSVST